MSSVAPTKTAGAARSVPALESASAGHVESIHHPAAIDIGDADVENQFRLASPKRPAEETGVEIAAIQS
jgi:uncharacterized protein YwlG (UPF0340 family)